MVRQAVTRAWLISRQQSPAEGQQPAPFSAESPGAHRRSPDTSPINGGILGDCRQAVPPEPREDDSFWTSHHFWKGIVLGVLLVVLIKTVFEVQAPFGIDWYDF